jgi:UTP--glucose-1-phosphate uridylyltransferase
MRELTAGAPKEMLPLAGEPLIGWVARECAASGIAHLHVVTAPGKDSIREYLEPRAGAPGFPATIDFALQHQPRGLADAIRVGWPAPDAAVAVALPDNLFLDASPALQQVIASYDRTGKNTVAIVAVDAADASARGPTSVYPGRLHGDEFEIALVPSKGGHATTFDTEGATTAYTGVGRYVFLPETLALIERLDRTLPLDRERDDIPVLQQLFASGRLSGCLVQGTFLDVGLPSGFRDAAARTRSELVMPRSAW